ncbi:multidrug efflux RND transporter permease subunit [Sphingobium sp. H33]|uniref:Efflux pump membrane transporter n=1 Tax=Sphingobium nicotianae TaxID=2782607 RepID=A0A9X1DGL2_9SPHN|nr:efflux RND transporter permease subunit [Sphingobium nicotianae]
MGFSHFFIARPVFACAICVFITLIGLIAYPRLAVDQYPPIAPPSVTVTAVYPGASAEVMADTVAAPLEQQINGVDDTLYIASTAIGDGRVTITVTFKIGTDPDLAQVKVQNRLQTALPQLPQEVQTLGVTVRKAQNDNLMIIHMYSTSPKVDRDYLANYASLQVRERLLRLPGVGDIGTFAARDYAMRIWIDPDRAAARNLTVAEILAALRGNNIQLAAGTIGGAPFTHDPAATQLNLQVTSKLNTPEQFANVIVKRDTQGRVTRIGDIARVELGAQNYSINAYLNHKEAFPLSVVQASGGNALETASAVYATMADLSKNFPPGVAYKIVFDPSQYVRQSIEKVRDTLVEAIILVVIVVILFLQRWRTAIIPLLAIPISLIGTFAVMAAVGFSLNNLSLFGLVLSIGIVVDDAIVVVENVERHIREGMHPREAAHLTMDEVGGALIGIALVLVAVFVPTAFMGGLTGQFYKQFALTVTAATLISLIVSLTLSPALCALILKPHDAASAPRWAPLRWLADQGERFSGAFDRFSAGYGQLTRRLLRMSGVMFLIYAGLLLITGWRLYDTPRGFVPQQDQGVAMVSIQMPPGASLARTDAVTRQAIDIMLSTPGISAASVYSGVDALGFTISASSGQMYAIFEPFETRLAKGLTGDEIIADLRKRYAKVIGADIRVMTQPPIRGLGSAGGFRMMIEDRGGLGYGALDAATRDLAAAANEDPAIANAFANFNMRSPRVAIEVDRDKAEMLGVQSQDVYATLQTYMAGSYVNNINLLGHTFQVIAQADPAYRQDEALLGQLKTRSASGAMVPIDAVATLTPATGPYRVLRHNLYPAADVQGDAAPGYSSGQAMAAMERIARERLPAGLAFEWTDLAYQQGVAGGSGELSFVLAVVFVFIALAAFYESLTLPLAIILTVPLCLLAAILGVNLRGADNNILTQIGMVVLIGLAAKNAILIVEFARQSEEKGAQPKEAAVLAAQIRLRPILMTSLAFIAGVVPLAFATGAGSEIRQALGTAVFFGMIGLTALGLIFTPVFYVACRSLGRRAAQLREGWRRKPLPASPELAE